MIHTPMPPNIISASLLVCEKVLSEKDHVQSVIRIVDLFYVPMNPEIPEQHRVALMYLFLHIKSYTNDDSEQIIRFEITRPSGEMKVIGDPIKTSFASVWDDKTVPGGTTAVLQLYVTGKELGTHFVRAFLNDEQVAQAIFTLAARPIQDLD